MELLLKLLAAPVVVALNWMLGKVQNLRYAI